ncbi:MAG: DUF2791 family P-loop domain-containing protein [Candidatus Stahlbacteria bacterium]|nr:DUF2791 family P-loop domain-containing protein [Candidatus Stahlbacteria bacterium]
MESKKSPMKPNIEAKLKQSGNPNLVGQKSRLGGIEVEYPHIPWLGKGKVVSERWKGQELLIQFDRGLTIWVPKTKLKLKEEYKKVCLPLPPHKLQESELTAELHRARKMVEAFRLGIVPHDEVQSFIFGRDKEIESLNAAFKRMETLGGSVITIEGEYGAGKTHFLDYIYSTALKNGYAVAKAALDPIDVTPFKAKNIYRELVKSFRFRQGDTPCLQPQERESQIQNPKSQGREDIPCLQPHGEKNFRDFLIECANFNDEVHLFDDHKFLTPMLKNIKNADDIIWKWIEGEPMKRWYQDKVSGLRKLPTLSDFSTASDNYCYILSGIGYLAQKMGLKGFVILIDEAETLFHSWWQTVAMERGVNLFKGLALTTLGELPTTLSNNIEKDAFYNAYIERVGGYTLIHRGVRSCMTPYLYRKPANLFLGYIYHC